MKEEVLILLIVDLADLPSSIFKDLPNIIGYNKPVIIVGEYLSFFFVLNFVIITIKNINGNVIIKKVI